MTTTRPQHASMPSPALITELQAVREYPAVSVLLATSPSAEGMRRSDATRLDHLAARAAMRVRSELPPLQAAVVIGRLHLLCSEAWRHPSTRGLAIYASPSYQAIVRLPLPVADTCIVDPTFATRELIRALHRTPRHLVLELGSDRAQLFDAAGDKLRPALTSDFPVHDRSGMRMEPSDEDAGGAGEWKAEAAHRDGRFAGAPGLVEERASTLHRRQEYLARVDQALGGYAELHPAPLLVIGDPAMSAAFVAQSRHCDRLAGIVRGRVTGRARHGTVRRIRETLNAYLARRETEALDLVSRRAASGRVVSGIRDAWLAARMFDPQMLVVDEALYVPARLQWDGEQLVPATDAEHPEVLDDAVDELIELVLTRGGWIAFAQPGALAAHDGVALVVHA